MLTKDVQELKNQLKESKSDAKDKEQRLLNLTNQFSESKNKFKQNDYTTKLELERQKSQI